MIATTLFRRQRTAIALATSLNALLCSSWLYADAVNVNAQLNSVWFELERLATLGENDQLAVEIDGYDVTALVARSDNRIDINLETPLAAGEHRINVLVFYSNGNIDTLMEETLAIGGAAPAGAADATTISTAETPATETATTATGSAASSNTQHQLHALFSNNYRSDEKDKSTFQNPDIPRHTGNGGLSYRGQGSENNWQWQAELDTLYDNISENNMTGNEWEMPNYRLAVAHGEGLGKTGLSVGNYTVYREDLMFSSYQRRGLGGSLGDAENSIAQVDIFGLQSEPITDYNSRLGLPKSAEERSSGGLFTLSPLSNQPQLLKFSGAYLEGETTDSGTGLVSPDYLAVYDPENPDIIEFGDTVYGGSSWNIAADSWLGNNSLWLRFDYAESDFDSDGLRVGNDYQRDNSKEFQLQASSGSWFAAGPFDQWVLTLQRRDVGINFFSLGNLSLPGDVQLDRANWQASVGSWQIETEIAKEQNNLDNEDYLPDQSNHRRMFNVYYYPAVDSEKAPWNIIGVPSLNAGISETRRKQDNEDALIAGYDMDDETDETVYGATFYQTYWNWSLQHTIQDTADDSVAVEEMGYTLYEPASDQRNRITALQLGFTPTNTLAINANWQWSKNQETDFNNVYRSNARGLDIGWQIVPQEWQVSASYYRGRDQSEFGEDYFFGDSVLQETASLQLTWSQWLAEGRRPGLDWYIKTSYMQQDSQLYSELGLEDWQLMVGFDLSWQINTD